MKTCPYCKATNEDSANKCDCSYRFDGPSEQSSRLVKHQTVILRGIDLPWVETFYQCLKLAICAIPAIWVAYLAFQLPGIIFGSAATIKSGAELRDAAKAAQEEQERILRQPNPLR